MGTHRSQRLISCHPKTGRCWVTTHQTRSHGQFTVGTAERTEQVRMRCSSAQNFKATVRSSKPKLCERCPLISKHACQREQESILPQWIPLTTALRTAEGWHAYTALAGSFFPHSEPRGSSVPRESTVLSDQKNCWGTSRLAGAQQHQHKASPPLLHKASQERVALEEREQFLDWMDHVVHLLLSLSAPAPLSWWFPGAKGGEVATDYWMLLFKTALIRLAPARGKNTRSKSELCLPANLLTNVSCWKKENLWVDTFIAQGFCAVKTVNQWLPQRKERLGESVWRFSPKS